ncbi:ABC transporter permease [Pseudomonas oryzihabitans]|uniref:Transport permease protein n=1 Tax=Pseudomonas oryzihabitans TaxID=47885 RepID=A0AAJ2BQ47_9PSED|nr:lipopolysaccharide transport system permease protein [Pseudomonas psychrotolerans]
MKILFRNTGLIFSLTRREIESRYKGSIFGVAWSLLTPIIMLSIYSFIFGYVFKNKWGMSGSENYTLAMFTGLLVHGFLAECISKSTSIYVGNVSYVKKVFFPLESLCWVVVFSALFQLLMGSIVYAFFCILLGQHVSYSVLLIPVIIAPLVLLSYSLSLILSSLGVYIRDLNQLVSVLISIMLFMSPVFYPVTAIPAEYRSFIYISPLTFIIESLREVIIFDRIFSVEGYLIYVAVCLLTYFLSVFWFKKVSKGFADVL